MKIIFINIFSCCLYHPYMIQISWSHPAHLADKISHIMDHKSVVYRYTYLKACMFRPEHIERFIIVQSEHGLGLVHIARYWSGFLHLMIRELHITVYTIFFFFNLTTHEGQLRHRVQISALCMGRLIMPCRDREFHITLHLRITRETGYAILLCPEHSHTSPNKT